MTSRSTARFSEMRIVLESARAELVRAFVREAFLGDGISATVAGLIAEDTADAWQALCTLGSGGERARIETLRSGQDVRSRIFLPGHSRFAGIAACLVGRIRGDARISWREHGIDGWEVTVHRSLTGHLEPPPAGAAEERPSGPAIQGDARDYTIERPQKADAAGIARCFLAVYGHTYVHPEVFSPARYWDEVERGELIPVVARDDHGEIVGHVALERGPGMQVAERGEAVVLPAHRGHGLLERMTEILSEEALKYELHGIYAEPVTLHTFSQRNDERAGMPVCAVLLGVNPENVRPKDVPGAVAGQRQSYLRTFRFLRPPAPRTVYAPVPYREILYTIYASLGVTVSEPTLTGAAAAESRTCIRVNGRGSGMISFEQIGPNAPIELAQALRDVLAFGAVSVQLSARIDDPGLPRFTDAARDLGFFFCGLGPGFADGIDILVLQFLSEPLDTGQLQLFTDRTKHLVRFIDSDRNALAPRHIAGERAGDAAQPLGRSGH